MQSNFPQPLHFIGIGGSGMQPLVIFAQSLGMDCQGSDLRSSVATKELERIGIKIYFGHDAKNIDDAKAIIYSSAIPIDNPELIAAKEKGIPLFHRSDLLAEFFHTYPFPVGVLGTHGKSTTSAMITHILSTLKLKPDYVLGANIVGQPLNLTANKHKYFIAEIDESDGSFQKFRPYVCLVNNLDADHLDFFSTHKEIISCFNNWLRDKQPQVQIFGGDNPGCRELISASTSPVLTFGFNKSCDYQARSISLTSEKIKFQLVTREQKKSCELSLLGRHNVLNALAAIAVCHALNQDLDQIIAALRTFPGVERRLRTTSINSCLLVDDYAHNPQKIAAAINTIKQAHPAKNLLVVFEPHRYSRWIKLKASFLEAFALCDEVLVLPFYSAGEKIPDSFDLQSVSRDIQNFARKKCDQATSEKDAMFRLIPRLTSDIAILFIGAGNIKDLHDRLIELKSEEKKI